MNKGQILLGMVNVFIGAAIKQPDVCAVPECEKVDMPTSVFGTGVELLGVYLIYIGLKNE